VEAAFDRPLRFVFHSRRWTAEPATLGARIAVGAAVTQALRSRARGRVRPDVSVNLHRLRRYVVSLDRKLSKPALNAEVVGLGSDLRPIITEGTPGERVDRPLMTNRIVKTLDTGKRATMPLAVQLVQPAVTAATVGPIIVIKRNTHRLVLYNGSSPWQSFGVATGQSQYPTPPGDWHIVDMQVNPWWRPPDSAWAAGADPIPPGPGNPLGTRWMGLDAAGVGIHATPDDASIGYSASHGCIRMHQPDAEWLFGHVRVGTPVFIRSA
jgi:lipoprotein-anchoring transpeptidase ErfK/SrfK